MKCSSCGKENLEGQSHCGQCGALLQKPIIVPSRSRPESHKFAIEIVSVVVCLAIVLLVIVVYVRLSTPKDSDGDGVPDAEDPYPFDPDRWEVPMTPAAIYSKTPILNGERINIVSITKTDVPWDDVKIQMSDGNNFWEWDTATADLEGGAPVTKDYGSVVAGSLIVWLNVTDLGGNGFVSGSDYFSVSGNGGFDSGTTYVAVLIYELTGERIGTGIAFTG